METPMADTRWLTWRHRGAFQRVGAPSVLILIAFIQPRTIEEAEKARTQICELRYVRNSWLFYNRAATFARPELRRRFLVLGYGLTPLTSPGIHDIGDVLEVLLRLCASPKLRRVMGGPLDSWDEDPNQI